MKSPWLTTCNLNHIQPEHSNLLYTFVPQTNILEGDTRYMIHVLNTDLSLALTKHLKHHYSLYFKGDKFLFSYNEPLRRTYLILRKGI